MDRPLTGIEKQFGPMPLRLGTQYVQRYIVLVKPNGQYVYHIVVRTLSQSHR